MVTRAEVDPEAVARARQTIANLFPHSYRATHRAIITVRGKQFTCDGVLAVSADRNHHLLMVSSLGLVTDLQMTPAGECDRIQVTPLFRESWSRRFVARDLRWMFVHPASLKAAGRLPDGRLVLESEADAEGTRARYVFTAGGERWQETELVNHGRSTYRMRVGRYKTLDGMDRELPSEFEVIAKSHRLALRITEFALRPSVGTEVSR